MTACSVLPDGIKFWCLRCPYQKYKYGNCKTSKCLYLTSRCGTGRREISLCRCFQGLPVWRRQNQSSLKYDIGLPERQIWWLPNQIEQISPMNTRIVDDNTQLHTCSHRKKQPSSKISSLTDVFSIPFNSSSFILSWADQGGGAPGVPLIFGRKRIF